MTRTVRELLIEEELCEALRKRAERNYRKPLWEIRAILREVLLSDRAQEPFTSPPNAPTAAHGSESGATEKEVSSNE